MAELEPGGKHPDPRDLTAAGAFERYDETPDALFYEQPRFVTHIDDAAIAAVTQLYEEFLPHSGSILDVMSSWVSHLPPAPYWRVVGLGMNAEELASNPQLDQWVVKDLNQDPRIPFASGEFDGAAICVSIQYLTQPVEVLKEIGRVLGIGAPLVVTFSNRCFPTKAVRLWQSLGDRGHLELVQQYLAEAGNWSDIQALDHSPGGGDPLYAVVARSAGPAEGAAPFPITYPGHMVDFTPRPSGPQVARLELPVTDLARSRQFYQDYFGFDASEPASDGNALILRNSGAFALVLVPFQSPGTIKLGFSLPGPEAVRDLYVHLLGHNVDVGDDREEPDYVGFQCLDPDGHVINVYWEA